MFKVILFLYIICFGCYIIFSREPDFLEAETASGTIIKQNNKWLVQYNVGDTSLTANAEYTLRRLVPGEKVTVIYNPANPESASLYRFWGYWLQWNELIMSIICIIVGYVIAATVTNNPVPEALMEEEEASRNKPRKSRYES